MNNLKAGHEKVFGKVVLTDPSNLIVTMWRMAIIGKLIILYWGIISRKTLLKGLRECLYFSVQNVGSITGYTRT